MKELVIVVVEMVSGSSSSSSACIFFFCFIVIVFFTWDGKKAENCPLNKRYMHTSISFSLPFSLFRKEIFLVLNKILYVAK